MREYLLTFMVVVFLGCGVMSNPKEESSNNIPTQDEAQKAQIAGDFRESLNLWKMKIKDGIDLSLFDDYRVFEDQSSLDRFRSDLNSSADFKELVTLLNMKLDKSHKVLFYPIRLSENCKLIYQLLPKNEIKIDKTDDECQEEDVQIVLLYVLEKDTKEVQIDQFGEKKILNLSN